MTTFATDYDTGKDPESGFNPCSKCGKMPVVTSSFSFLMSSWTYGAACCGRGHACETPGALRVWWNMHNDKPAGKKPAKNKSNRRKTK